MNESTILRAVPAADELHKVQGFDPMKYLYKAVNAQGEPVMRLEPRYQRLWFRLACPKGRILLNPLRITDQLAIFEAKVFFHKEDAIPASSFTATKTVKETPSYIRAAQDEALKEALDNAGFGIQLCDVTQAPREGGRILSTQPTMASNDSQKKSAQPHIQTEQAPQQEMSDTPVPEEIQKAQQVAHETAPTTQTPKVEAPITVEPTPKETPVVQPNQPATQETESAPVPEYVPAREERQVVPDTAQENAPQKNVDGADIHDSADTALSQTQTPAREERQDAPDTAQQNGAASSEGQRPTLSAVLGFHVQREEPDTPQKDVDGADTNDSTDTALSQRQTPAQAPTYTDDMPVEKICEVMTIEDAQSVVVPRGLCMGWTMAQVAERRPSSLRFFLTDFCGYSNIQKAAATLLIQDLEQRKAG